MSHVAISSVSRPCSRFKVFQGRVTCLIGFVSCQNTQKKFYGKLILIFSPVVLRPAVASPQNSINKSFQTCGQTEAFPPSSKIKKTNFPLSFTEGLTVSVTFVWHWRSLLFLKLCLPYDACFKRVISHKLRSSLLGIFFTRTTTS